MKKIVLAFAVLLFFVFTGAGMPDEQGSAWVYDEPQVISEETEEFIRSLNEDIFTTYKNKPQLGIMIINELPEGYTIDEYKLEQFNIYGVGTKEENCGMLFVFAINDRKYGFEIGDGFEKGTLLRKDLEADFITSDMKTLLREENYDAVVLQVAEYLGQLMEDEENGVYAQKEQERLLQAQQWKRYNRLGFVLTLGVVGSVFLLVFVGVGVKNMISYHGRKKKLKELIETHYRHVRIVNSVGGGSEDSLLEVLIENAEWISPADLETKFLSLLYEIYLKCSYFELEKMELKDSISTYEEYLEKVNDFEAFSCADVKGLDYIVTEVNRNIEKAQAIEKQNHKKIQDFILAHKAELLDKNVSTEDMEEELQGYCRYGVEMTDEVLQELFQKELKSFVFRYEYEMFIKEHADNIDNKYFNSQKFYDSLRHGAEYENYNINRGREWMLPLLFMHMEHRRHEIRMREERERQEAQRRREERARREKEQRNSTSSFGSGFGGGHSSGGGFSGGW